MPDYNKMVEPLALQLSKSVASYRAAIYPQDQLSLQNSGIYSMVKTLQDFLATMVPTINGDDTLPRPSDAVDNRCCHKVLGRIR